MFKPQFAPLVAAGTKRQTIRPVPKRPQDIPKVGDVESWREWLGKPYRSKQRELAVIEIVLVERLELEETPHEILISLPDRPLRGALLPIEQWNSFAQADGFGSMKELIFWFEKEHGLPFEGIVIGAKTYEPSQPLN
jgi:hypothetical protein